MWRFLILFLCLLSTSCNRQQANSDYKYKIALVPKGMNHQFWKSVHAGGKKFIEEYEKEHGSKIELVWIGPQEEKNVEQQINVVKNLVKKVDGICLAPNHSGSLVSAVLEANDAGVPVVIFDSGLKKGAEYVSYVATDNYHGGQLAADCMANLLNNKGNVILLRYISGSESTEQREKGFLDQIKTQYPDIKVLVDNKYGGTKMATAQKVATGLLRNHEQEVNGIFAVCEPNANGVLEALKETNLDKKVKFVAFDPSAMLRTGLKDGSVGGIVIQDPVRMGYLAVKTMVEKLDGKSSIKKRISTGEYVATKENMNSPQMQKLLDPIIVD